jgi:hypothetical protein
MTRLNSIAKFAFATFAFFCVASPAVWAADKEGCKDIPGIKRFQGSQIENCTTRNFVEYGLPTGQAQNWDSDKKRIEGNFEELEGKLTRILYRTAQGASSVEVFRNYKNDLTSSGFKILYEAKNGETDHIDMQWWDAFGNLGGNEPRYAAAVKEENGVKSYVALWIANKGDDETIVALDLLTVGELKNKMTTSP